MNVLGALRSSSGLNLDDATVARAVRRRMSALGAASRHAYEAAVDETELAALLEEVVVPESWMFRDAQAFVVATQFVRQRARAVRILSAPCAGGEEPYSMAMALEDAGVPRSSYRIDAIDISEVALARARAGRYTRNAFRGVHARSKQGDQQNDQQSNYLARYFEAVGNGFQIAPWLRSQVQFSKANLLKLHADARYDVIFCRNLLIYFDDPTIAAAVQRLSALLHDDGILLAGYAEVPAFIQHGFELLPVPGAFALRKRGAVPVAAAAAQAPRRAPVKPAAPRPDAAPASAPAPAPAAPVSLLDQARRQADAGQLVQAAASCRQLLASEPHAAEAWFVLGLAEELQGEAGAADASYRRCVYLQPDHYEALCHLALLCEQQGDGVQAAALRQRAARVFKRRTGAPP